MLSYPIRPLLEALSLLIGIKAPIKLKPHLRANLVKALHAFSPDGNKYASSATSRISDSAKSMREMTWNPIFFESQIILENLFGGLMHQYVNVERSEGEQAAHETLVLRQEVAALFQFLCSSEAHKQQLVQLNESHGIVLVKFVNMLASDLTQFFDLGIEKLQRIKQAQIDQDAQAWDALEPDMRKAKEDQLKEDESHCPGIVRMVGELMFLLKTMTRTIPEGGLGHSHPRCCVCSAYFQNIRHSYF